jgi:peptidoglycan/xylan/chitin deacetylase (PgdA/CDA1 family)
VVLNYEEGAEPHPDLGDSLREERAEATYTVPRTERELIQESSFEYGSRAGHWRVLRLLDQYEATCTIFAVGYALELNPEITRAFAARNFDMVGHGYRWRGHFGMTEEEERLDVQKCAETVQALTGQVIGGWFNRPPVSLQTRRVLAEEGLFFDSTAVNDDLPYYTDVAGRPMLVVPYAIDANDTRFWKGGYDTAAEFFEYLRDAFDVLYRESQTVPLMMSVGLHGRIIGRPGRILALERFLDHVRSRPDVWISRRTDIATTWADQFAPDDAWNWPRPKA